MGQEAGRRAVRDSIRRYAYSGVLYAGICFTLIGCDEAQVIQQSNAKAYPRVSIGKIEVQAPPNLEPRYARPTFVKASKEEVIPSPAFRVVRARVTAYCPCARCCGVMTGLTASQTNAWKPGVAADPTWLPRGTVVEIEDYGRSVIDDTGGKLKRKYWVKGIPRLDVRMTYHWQARDWGTRYLDVKIFK